MIETGSFGRRARTAAWLLVITFSSIARAQTPAAYRATTVLEFTVAEEPSLKLPTAVSVAADGTVYVADGVNDRIVVFAADGTVVRSILQVGSTPLRDPLSVRVGRRRTLWITESGNPRVIGAGLNGELLHEIVLPTETGGVPPDPTDAALTADGRYLWVVDNGNHRLVRVSVSDGTLIKIGKMGEAPGEFHYPFRLALAPDGHVLVSDSINGRVQVFDAAGQTAGTIGTYGVDLGNLYRPKGVAVDADGNVWVADGPLGVIQVFRRDGTVIDVLRDQSGDPFRFEMPGGIAFDAAGNLYVCELIPNRVRKLAIAIDRQASNATSGRRAPPGASAHPRVCTACHLEWMEPFASGGSTILGDPPATSPEDPVVSHNDTCLSCHDGSVVDSRRRVWVEHGHRRGVEPPEHMRVAGQLPLVDGKIACRTCHAAHVSGEPAGDSLREAVLLRVANSAGELCIACHEGHTRGPGLGTHPTGGMPWPIPQQLVDAGARVGPDPRELTCVVCHTPHGAAHEHLLVMGTESGQLCLACHDQMRPGMFREGDHTEHALMPQATEEQAAAIARLGTRLGPDGRLICLSCHKLHHGKGERFMLAAELTDGEMCLQCHSDKTSVLDTAHDLRAEFPEERNRLGMTAHTGGPCSACHLFHRYARPPETSDIDRGGHCVTCHQPGRCGEARQPGPENHPPIQCRECHDPHRPADGRFLRYADARLCARCHSDYGESIGGAHDVTSGAAGWPDEAHATRDACLACHRPHGDSQGVLFRAGLAEGAEGADAACLACHDDAVWDSAGRRAARHPRDASSLSVEHALPLGTTNAASADEIACRTCHNPHADSETAVRMLRIAPGQASASLCIQCHPDKGGVAITGHAPGLLAEAGLQSQSCRPCHNVHGDSSAIETHLMWPRAFSESAADAGGDSVAGPRCLACHRPDGPAPSPAIATHPEVVMLNPFESGSPGYLPLFNDAGEEDARGFIACGTCHVPHGRPPADRSDAGGDSLDRRETVARRFEVRRFQPPNVCTTCHGSDALRRFLYFHDPERRRSPLMANWPPLAGRQ